VAIVRWEPLREMNSLQSEMNRLFNTAFDRPSAGTRQWLPAMDLHETDEHFVLRADLPGLAEEDVSIELEDNVLTLSGERKPDEEERGDGFHRVERAFGAFSRSLTLPQGIDPESVSAGFARGVLEVRIPKPEQRKPRKISISASDGEPRTLDGAAA
jgi:HSP20 family protein